MHNYYNILPSVIINVCIIFLFQGLLFLLYLLPLLQKEIAKTLYERGQESKEIFQQLDESIQNSNKLSLLNSSGSIISKSNIAIAPSIPSILAPSIPSIPILPNIQQQIKSTIIKALNLIVGISKKNEKDAFESGKTNYIIILTFTTFGLILLLLVYWYLIVKKWKKSINWKSIFISLIFIILFIIGFLLMYSIFILNKKKINEDKLKLFFISRLINI
jgi:hypothetical protein